MMNRFRLKRAWLSLMCAVILIAALPRLRSQEAESKPHFPPKTGVQTPGVQHDIKELAPIATFPVAGHPDWMAVSDGGVWVTSSSANHVVWLDAATNRPGTVVTVNKPCAGLAIGFGSLWIPSCGDHSIVRVDVKTGALQATIPAGPADSEGGIAASPDSIWIVTSKASDLARIDPAKNAIAATIRIPAGSFNPIFAGDSIWVSSNVGGTLVRVNPATNSVTGQTPVGPMPRFLTVGAGSIWVLNQGDGTVARVDAVTGQRTALISAGIPGFGGEIAFGAGAAWATVFDFPITRIDAETNEVSGQWHGAGGDSIRAGLGSIWLSSYVGAKVTRLPIPAQ
jgi:streptogramin lyase